MSKWAKTERTRSSNDLYQLLQMYLEPDNVACDHHPNALYEVTNDVNEGSTDINILLGAVFVGRLLSLPEFPLLNTPVTTCFCPTFLL